MGKQIARCRSLGGACPDLLACGAGGQAVQIIVFAAAAHQIQTGAGFSGERFEFPHRILIAPRQPVIDTGGQLSRRLRHSLARAGAVGAHCFDHALRGEKGRIVHINPGGEFPHSLRLTAQPGKVIFLPQLRADGLQHPEPHNVFQITDGAAEAAFIGQVGQAAGLGAVRFAALHADKRPGARAEEEEIFFLCRDSQHGGTGVVRGRKNHTAVKAKFRLKLRAQGTKHKARLLRFGENPARQAETVDQFKIPGARFRVKQLGGARVGIFRSHISRQQVMQVVGDHQQMLRLFEQFGLLRFHGHQLVNGIEDLLLDSCARVQFFLGDLCAQDFVHPGGMAVAVGHGVAQPVSLGVEQDKINAPGVHAHARRNFSDLRTAAQSRADLPEQCVRVPAAAAICIFGSVRKAPHLLGAKRVSFHPSQNHLSAGRADIDRQIIPFHMLSPFFAPWAGGAGVSRSVSCFHCKRRRQRKKGRCLKKTASLFVGIAGRTFTVFPGAYAEDFPKTAVKIAGIAVADGIGHIGNRERRILKQSGGFPETLFL